MSDEAAKTPRTMTIPEAGKYYLGLSRNGSYQAAARGEIPFVKIGRLKRVPSHLMERRLEAADKSAA